MAMMSILVTLTVLYIVTTSIRNAMARSGTGRGGAVTDGAYNGVIYVVRQQHCAVIERLGKFKGIREPGLHVRWPIIDRARDVSLMTEDEQMTFDAKTKDNVTIGLDVSVQYRVDSVKPKSGKARDYGIYKCLYTLTDPVSQMRDYFADALRSQIPKLDLDAVFEEKEAIAKSVDDAVSEKMRDYGYEIVTTLITSISLPEDVARSMNRIVASKNDLASAVNEAEAERKKVTIAAQAEAERMELEGKGIAAQRMAVASGLAESIDVVERSGLSPEEANTMLLFTQWVDMMNGFAKSGEGTTVLLPNDFGSASSMFEQIVAANKVSDGHGPRTRRQQASGN